jgi:hypothetical protein
MPIVYNRETEGVSTDFDCDGTWHGLINIEIPKHLSASHRSVGKFALLKLAGCFFGGGNW